MKIYMLKHTKTIRNVYQSDSHIPSAFWAIARPRPMEDFGTKRRVDSAEIGYLYCGFIMIYTFFMDLYGSTWICTDLYLDFDDF